MPEEYQAPDEELLDDEGLPGELDPDDPDYQGGTEEDDEEGELKGEKKALKDTKAALTREQQRRAELERDLAKAQGALEVTRGLSRSEQKEKAAAITDFLDDPDFKDRLLDDPSNVAGALKRLVSDIGKELTRRDEFIIREIRKQSPERQSLKDKIAELKATEEFADWDEDFLVPIAKREVAAERNASRQVDEDDEDDDDFRGTPGSGRRVGAPVKKKKDAFEKEVDRWYSKIGYDRFDKKGE